MLELPNPIGDEKADRIVGSFVNNRLVALMEEAISSERYERIVA